MSDALSDLLSTISITQARWMVVESAAGVSYRMASTEALQFIVTLHGSLYLHSGCCAPVSLPPATVLLIAPDAAFHISDTDKANGVESVQFEPGETGLITRTLGPGQTKAAVLYGSFEIERFRWAPLRRMLPRTLIVRSEDGNPFPWLHRTTSLRPLQTAIYGPGADAVSSRWAEICVLQIIRHFASTTDAGIRLDAQLVGDAKIAQALREINARPSAPWTVAALARRVGMSRSGFADGFLRTVGETPFRYITQMRLAVACKQLRCERLPILEIAAQAGYGSDIAFIRTFKRVYGMTPSDYRARHLTTRREPIPSTSSAYPAFVFWESEPSSSGQ